jgi:hypothetical protein
MQYGKLMVLSEQAFVSCTPNDNHCGGAGEHPASHTT